MCPTPADGSVVHPPLVQMWLMPTVRGAYRVDERTLHSGGGPHLCVRRPPMARWSTLRPSESRCATSGDRRRYSKR